MEDVWAVVAAFRAEMDAQEAKRREDAAAEGRPYIPFDTRAIALSPDDAAVLRAMGTDAGSFGGIPIRTSPLIPRGVLVAIPPSPKMRDLVRPWSWPRAEA